MRYSLQLDILSATTITLAHKSKIVRKTVTWQYCYVKLISYQKALVQNRHSDLQALVN